MQRRMARLGDGWMVNRAPDADTVSVIQQVREGVAEAGRDPRQFGIQGSVAYSTGPEKWPAQLEKWRDLDASDVSLITMNAGLTSPAAHIEAIRSFREALPA